jgi:hypothetical protein
LPYQRFTRQKSEQSHVNWQVSQKKKKKKNASNQLRQEDNTRRVSLPDESCHNPWLKLVD